MRVTAELSVDLGSSKACEALTKALRPDDEKPPRSFNIRSSCMDGTFNYIVEGFEGETQLLTLASIIDEVSRLVELIIKVLAMIQ